MAKPTNSTTNTKGCVAKPVQTDGAKTGNQPKKVITFSTIDNFGYQSWRDFSDSRLIDPSKQYPIIEIEIALNFFPGGKHDIFDPVKSDFNIKNKILYISFH